MARHPINHVVIMDGTLSSLKRDGESNAGLTFKLLCEMSPSPALSLKYEEGIQWCSWRSMVDLAAGNGINGQIRRAYGFIASRYRPGDKIFLFGFSRGAYAVRSLAGVIDLIGLLKPSEATPSNILQAFRYYKNPNPGSSAALAFAAARCCPNVKIEMVGVWDTVKALGIQYPVLWRLAPKPTDFHNHDLGDAIRNGFQALALNETRVAFSPVLWSCKKGWKGRLEQAWFRGGHADVGGQIGTYQAARPLSNIPLVWMLDHAESCGLPLPGDWRARFPQDPSAPAVGTFRGIAKYFLFRKNRMPLTDPSEYLHPSVASSKPPQMGAKMPPRSVFTSFRKGITQDQEGG